MSPAPTRIQKELQLKFPLIVAPMAGGPSTADLVISSSEAGALGSIGGAYLSAPALREFAGQVRSKTTRPFAINLFVPGNFPPVSPSQIEQAVHGTQKYRRELGLPAPNLHPPFEEDFNEQFEEVLKLRPRALSFVFGLPAREFLHEALKRGIYVMGTATTPDEALELQEAGVSAVVAQGVEAGGHRGIFGPTSDDPEITRQDLLRKLKDKIKIPIVAAGGLMTAKDIQSALREGADAVQMGTAFLATKEAGTSAPYRSKLLEGEKRITRLTRAFSGRLARGIVNRFMAEMDSRPEAILPFPVQNKFTRDMRQASVKAGSADFISLWCGTGEGKLWTGTAGELIKQLFS